MHRWRGREPLRKELVGGTEKLLGSDIQGRTRGGSWEEGSVCVCVSCVYTHTTHKLARRVLLGAVKRSAARERTQSSSALLRRLFPQKLLSDSLAAAPPRQTPGYSAVSAADPGRSPFFLCSLSLAGLPVYSTRVPLERAPMESRGRVPRAAADLC